MPPQWEYLNVSIPPGTWETAKVSGADLPRNREVEALLDLLGVDSWELVTVVGESHYIFKRQKGPGYRTAY